MEYTTREFLVICVSSSQEYDPFARWRQIGKFLNDELLGWLTVGVNLADILEQPISGLDAEKSNTVPRNNKRGIFDDHLGH
ncbi:hypothetical protein CC78DRAFT_584832 [Lojkania enalia]|uniref:Uncharacterized protein n=1 Tax=Lojkania enalia TaxID=147567 RepID=A0A9P4MZL4_9PLEO|nr:hypothetical protein CC78DRAFT_584832 [Didymosphaeria enalia]